MGHARATPGTNGALVTPRRDREREGRSAAEGGARLVKWGRESVYGGRDYTASRTVFTAIARRPSPDHFNAGTLGGSLRHFVACSYPYASLINRASSNARPKKVMPAGSVLPRV